MGERERTVFHETGNVSLVKMPGLLRRMNAVARMRAYIALNPVTPENFRVEPS